MIGQRLSIFLAGLAMAAGSPSVPVPRTCEEQSGTTCQDCLGYDDINIGDEPKQSNCAWFVPPGGEPQCIGRKRCDDKGFEVGKCVVGLKSKPSVNSRRCKKANKNTCESIKGCNNCLLGRKNKNDQGPFLECAYFVRGDEMRCIAESKCDDKGFEGGFCTVLPDNPIDPEILLDPKPACRAIKKKKTKEPKPTSEPTKSPPVGFETCSDFSGDNNDSCRTCLGQGCSWIQQSKMCMDSCEGPQADFGCVRDETHEYSVAEFDQNNNDETHEYSVAEFDPNHNRRSLLSFEDNKSFVCYTVSIDERNNDKCYNAPGVMLPGGCVACKTTPLLNSMVPFNPPTCKYSYEQGCYAVANPLFEPPTPLFCDLPKTCTEWPELLGWELLEAHIYLSNIYGKSPDVEIEAIGPDDFVTEDIRLNRIRLFYNDALTIIKIPRTEHSNCGGGAPLPKEGTEWPEFVGQNWEEAEEYLSNAYDALNIYVVYEKDPVTSDYRLDRVFLFHDLDGKISSVPRVG